MLTPLTLILAVIAGCGSSHSSPSSSCRTDEDKITTGECVPDYDIAVPGEEGSGVDPEGAPEKRTNTTPYGFGPDPSLSPNGARFIAGFEGFRSCPYWDPYGRVWTRAFGETGGISRSSPCISRGQGETNLRRLVATRYEHGVRTIGVAFNQNQWDALASFAYNLGPGIFTGNLRTQLRRYNPSPMLAYNKAGGRTLPGLVRRRNAEVALFRRRPAGTSTPAFDRTALQARQRTLRRVLLSHGCRRRKAAGQGLGPRCTHWFREGDQIGARLRAGR
jgi:GH24 family phage-related lysozyme (muramidase)